jgi:hypothetical protein
MTKIFFVKAIKTIIILIAKLVKKIYAKTAVAIKALIIYYPIK